MDDAGPTRGPDRQSRATDRFLAPVARPLRIAGVLSVASGLLWPLQAALIAWTVSNWVQGVAELRTAAVAAAAFFLCGAARAALDYRAGALSFDAADRIIAAERAGLIRREARSPGETASAAIAALLVQKLPQLEPWITRYRTAMIRVAVLPLVLVVLTCWFSWAVALILLVAGPLIPVFMALIGMAAEDASRRQMNEIGSMNAMLMDRLAAMTDIRLLGAGERAAEDFRDRAEGLREKTMAVLRIAFLSSTVLELFSAIGVAMVAVYVGFNLLGEIPFGSWGAQLTVGQGVFVLLIAPDFFQPLRDLAAAWHDRAAGRAVAAELEALDAEPRERFLGSGARADALGDTLTIRLLDAAAALPGGTRRLPDLSVSAGEAVALVGPSGSGKTTTLKALAGLLPLAAGRLEICGEALTGENADAWRARLFLLPQQPRFPGRELADYLDPRGNGADPWPALDVASARHVVERLPDGLSTRLGETGGGVSGGEARRLMIARAVMAGGDLLLADEPTADLDPQTARTVIEALLRLKAEGRTLIVATHDAVLAAALDRTVEVAR